MIGIIIADMPELFVTFTPTADAGSTDLKTVGRGAMRKTL
jgi:hypothetical protein